MVTCGMALTAAFALSASAAMTAEGEAKALPTLLIKGEVVSLDTNDPSGTLLKVKDRYGFETPIFVTTDTKVSQGDAASALSSLTPGVAVEVEYNFDVNTAKRHAVSVKLAAALPAAPAAPAPAASTSAPAAAPAAPPAAPAADAAQAAAPTESQPSAQPAASTPAPAEATAAPAQQDTAPAPQ
jgi:hypothetical protein